MSGGRKILWRVAAAAALSAAFALLAAGGAAAQCALCQTAVRAAGEQTARTMNTSILVLVIPPVAIFCSIFAVAYRGAKGRDEGN